MNLDDISNIQRIDQAGMLEKILDLPTQIQSGWSFVLQQEELVLPQINQIFFAGISYQVNIIEILHSMVSKSKAEIFLLENDLILPNYCNGRENLIILLVSAENVEEMKKLMDLGLERNCTIVGIFNNQIIKDNFRHFSIPNWVLNNQPFSRTTLGFDTFILYGILYKAGLVADITDEIKLLIKNLENTIQQIAVSVPTSLNPAKRLAGQMIGRWLKIVGGGLMLPIANHWSDQINKSAKAICNSEDIFHLVQHSLSGIFNPEIIAQQSMVVFLKSNFNCQEIETFVDQAKIELMCNGIGTDFYSAGGEDQLSHIWTTILFGDFLAYYLAIAYECDPTPIALLSF